MDTIIDADIAVGELVCQRPGRARVFEQLGIDYCCGGRKTLKLACREHALSLEDVCRRLETDDADPDGTDATDWTDAPLGDLVEHVVQTHHGYLRRELPRLRLMLGKVIDAHAAEHPELIELHQVLEALANELRMHMMKEEQVLFPWIKRLAGHQTSGPEPCGSVNQPIGMMEHEHDQAGQALARMRWLTADYRLPAGGCATYGALLDGLRELEADLHRHIHKENNILFPRASRLEASLPAGA